MPAIMWTNLMSSGEELSFPLPHQGCAVGVVRLNDFAQC